jgi:hypothetical protein
MRITTRSIRWIVFLLALTLTVAVQEAALGKEYGIIQDLAGSTEIVRADERFAADIGETLLEGDRLDLAEGARLTLVIYDGCAEWQAQGPGVIAISAAGMGGERPGALRRLRELPVCYEPEDLNTLDDHAPIAGILLRGIQRDPVRALREEFASGEISTPALITLIQYDIVNGKYKNIEPYLQRLEQHPAGSRLAQRYRRLVAGKR